MFFKKSYFLKNPKTKISIYKPVCAAEHRSCWRNQALDLSEPPEAVSFQRPANSEKRKVSASGGRHGRVPFSCSFFWANKRRSYDNIKDNFLLRSFRCRQIYNCRRLTTCIKKTNQKKVQPITWSDWVGLPSLLAKNGRHRKVASLRRVAFLILAVRLGCVRRPL